MAKAKPPADPYAHILPFPAGPLLISPTLATAEGKIYRSVIIIAFWFWITGCRPLPTDTATLAAIARMPSGNMVAIRSRIDAALAEILPMLQAHYDAAFKTRAARVAMAQFANQARINQRKAATRSANQLPKQPAATRFQPAKSPPYAGDGRTDMPARTAATTRSAATHTHATGLLREAGPTLRK